MKKQYIENKSLKSLSRREGALLELLEDNNLATFSASEVQRLLGINSNTARQTLCNLCRKQWIKRIKKGTYTLGKNPRFDFEAVCRAAWPAYISLSTALNYHGLTEQVPLVVFAVTTRQAKLNSVLWLKVKYATVKPARFFGYEKVNGFLVADKEKAIIDSLLFPKYVAVEEVAKALYNGRKELDLAKLERYALQVKNQSLVRRLGYLLEATGYSPVELKSNKRGTALLDVGQPHSGNIDKKWGLDLNKTKSNLLYFLGGF